MKAMTIFFTIILLITSTTVLFTYSGDTRSDDRMREYSFPDVIASYEGKGIYMYLGYDFDLIGDFNGDGVEDVAISSCGGEYHRHGYSFVLMGGQSEYEINGSYDEIPVSFRFKGDRVAGVGDVNGDGLDDFITSYVYDDCGIGPYAGQTYLIFGRKSGLGKDLTISDMDASFVAEGVGYYQNPPDSLYNGEHSGWAIDGVGDVNGDGYDDFAITAPRAYYNTAGYSIQAGKTYLIFGKSSGWEMRTNLSNADASFCGMEMELSGISVSGLGDVNGDGFDDLAIGGQGFDIDGFDIENNDYKENHGRVYLIFGKADGWERNQSLLDTADVFFTGKFRYQNMGTHIDGPGDLNGDGLDDIILSSENRLYRYDQDGNGYFDHVGDRYVFFGRTSGWEMDMDLDNADVKVPLTGLLLGVGDVNGDGCDDMMMTRFQQNYLKTPEEELQWKGNFLFLGKRGIWDKELEYFEADAHFDERLGLPYRAGDLDGDGYDEIAFANPTKCYEKYGEGCFSIVRYMSAPPDIKLRGSATENLEEILLSWDPGEVDNIVSIELFRSFDGMNYQFVSEIGATLESYLDQDVWPYRDHFYFIRYSYLDSGGTSRTDESEKVRIFNGPDHDDDGIPDIYDEDDDGDLIPDVRDMFPLNESEWSDTDLDGIGNNLDEDDDNDGILDVDDPHPLDPKDSILILLEELNNSRNKDREELLGLLAGIQTDLERTISGTEEEIMKLLQDITSGIDNNSNDTSSSLTERISELKEELEMAQMSMDLMFILANVSFQNLINGYDENGTRMFENLSEMNEVLRQLRIKTDSLDDLEEINDSTESTEKNSEDNTLVSIIILVLVALTMILLLLNLFFNSRRRSNASEYEKWMIEGPIHDNED